MVSWLAVAAWAAVIPVACCQVADLPAKTPEWRPPAEDDVRTQVWAWLDAQEADEKAMTKAHDLWAGLGEEPTGDQLLQCLTETFSVVDTDVAALVRLCSQPKTELLLPSHSWLHDPETPPLMANNLRLLYGRWLAQQQLYDEALVQIADLNTSDVVAPALLLFYQGVCHHTLLDRERGLKAVADLLDGAEESPRRYVAVARLMQRDLEGLENDTLDHIARRMGDIRRRLDLGRASEKVQDVERGVIESLDKLIKKLEEQQSQQGGGGSSGDNLRSSSPAQDSQIIGGRGRGDVTKRRIGSEADWGDLPPKQREEALQQIGRDFPPHYHDVIQQYFRRLAAEGSQ